MQNEKRAAVLVPVENNRPKESNTSPVGLREYSFLHSFSRGCWGWGWVALCPTQCKCKGEKSRQSAARRELAAGTGDGS